MPVRRLTNNQGRDVLGTGGVVNTRHSGSRVKRITEDQASRGLDDWSPETKKTPEDLIREREERESKEGEA